METTGRYVEVPADRLFTTLRTLGGLLAARGGSLVEGMRGQERIVDLHPPRSRGFVRVFTTVPVGARAARACGEDAVRIAVLVKVDDDVREVTPTDRVFRTAPRDGDRVRAFLDRLTARVRTAVGHAMDVPACPSCGASMVHRVGPRGMFWGCPKFRDGCRGSRPLKPARDAHGRRAS